MRVCVTAAPQLRRTSSAAAQPADACTRNRPALQMLFGLLAAVMVGVRYKSDARDRHLHHGSWLVKVALWLVFNVLPFFFPNGLVNAYCEPGAAALAGAAQERAYTHCTVWLAQQLRSCRTRDARVISDTAMHTKQCRGRTL